MTYFNTITNRLVINYLRILIFDFIYFTISNRIKHIRIRVSHELVK